MRGMFIVFCALISAISAYYGRPLMADNSDAITILITVITVFAGFLVAIIAVMGDPAMIPEGPWRKAEARHSNLELAIIRHTWLFRIYLCAIGFLFAGVLVRKEPDATVIPLVKHIIEWAYLFFGVFSFLLTTSLPHALGKMQLARSEAEIEARRRADGIPPVGS